MTPHDEQKARAARMEKLARKYPSLRPPKVKPRVFPSPLLPWSDAQAYRDAGFYVIPVEHFQLEAGHEVPSGGASAWGLIGDPTRPENCTVGILPAVLPLRLGLDECLTTRCGVARIDADSKHVAAALFDVVLRYLPGAPVRTTTGSHDLLVPFRLENQFDARDSSHHTNTAGNRVQLETAATCFIPGGGPYAWTDGRDLLAVPRTELPLLTRDAAVTLMRECVDVLTAGVPKPSLLSLLKSWK
jgi:hypothetical protein